jgi:hypothetical protein
VTGGRRLGRRRVFTAEEVVDALYRGLLDRPAESTGLAFQTARLYEGVGLAEIVHGVGHSREYFETWLRGGDLPALMEELWRGAEQRRSERPIYLMHIMKTGGTALVEGLTAVADGRFCVHQTFLDHLVAMPELVRRGASLVSGHLGMEAVELLPTDLITSTVIRNPVERVLSHYSHVLRDPALQTQTIDLTLEEFVQSPRWRPYASNFQATNLVQKIGLSDIWSRHSPRDLLERLPGLPAGWHPELPVQAVFEMTPLAMSAEELRRRALDQLDRIDHVGTSDDLEALFGVLARRWGVESPPPLGRSNVGTNRSPVEQIPAELVVAINDANPVDWELYERARARTPHSPVAQSRAPVVSSPSRPPGQPDRPDRPEAARRGPSAPRGDRRSRYPVGARVGRRPGLAGAAACLAVAGLDLAFVQGIALLSLVVAGPCLAVFGGRWRPVALVGVLSVALSLVLCIPDGVWGSSDQAAVIVLVSAVAGLATVAGFALGHSRHLDAGPDLA